MKRVLAFATIPLFTLTTVACGNEESAPAAENAITEAPPDTIGGILRVDPAVDALIPADTEIEKLADGFVFIEGPCGTAASPGCSSPMCEVTRSTNGQRRTMRARSSTRCLRVTRLVVGRSAQTGSRLTATVG